MNVLWDYFNQQDKPAISLCNPAKGELYSLNLLFKDKLKLKYNALSEYEFQFPQKVDGTIIPAYDLLKAKRLVLIAGIGYFQINKVVENLDGKIPTKTISCTSLEAELNNKKINSFNGTLKFHDPISPDGTFLQLILDGTGWSVGDIDSDLWNIYRTFAISDSTVYNALMTDAETAYGCVFTFNTFTKTVNAFTTEHATTDTSIYISFDNLLKKASFTEISDEIVTAMSVYGGGSLDIRAVNPLGTNYLYNFDYYKTTDWMSQELIDAITAWQALVDAQINETYDDLLQSLVDANAILVTLNTELTDLQDQKAVIVAKKAFEIAHRNRANIIAKYNAQIAVLNTSISAKNVEINNQTVAIASIQSLIDSSQVPYAYLVTQLKDANSLLIVEQGQLVDLQATMDGLVDVKKVKVEGGLSLTSINAQIAAQQALINSKTTTITNQQTVIDNLISELEAINDMLSFENNFTDDELTELQPFIIQNVYQNTNIITTDIMTSVEVQTQEQELYDQARTILATVSIPRYEFGMEMINLLALKEFQPFIDEMNLGAICTVNVDNGVLIETALLEIDMSFDSPSDFSTVFSNRLRLDGPDFIFSDLFGNVNKTGTAVNFNSTAWANWSANYKDTVTTFIASDLNATNNALINSTNQEVVIDRRGLVGRQFLPATNTYSPNQVWLTSSILAFTKDNFATSSLALGQVVVNGQTVFGLVADAVVGRLLAGNQLSITNSGNNFLLDSNGAVLTNASFTLTNAHNTIILNPSLGFKIQSIINGNPVDNFFLDNAGNINMTGTINAQAGTFTGTINANAGNIGGWIIDSTGISKGTNFIRSNGTLKVGPLSITGPSTGTFSGTFQATNLIGQIVTSQIGDGAVTNAKVSNLRADSITAGTLTGINIFGSTIAWGNTFASPNVTMYGQDTTGILRAKGGIQTYVEDGTASHTVLSTLFLESTGASLYVPGPSSGALGAGGTVNLGIGQNTVRINGNTLNLSVVASIITPSGSGYNGSVIAGTRTLYFSRGILYNVT